MKNQLEPEATSIQEAPQWLLVAFAPSPDAESAETIPCEVSVDGEMPLGFV